MTQVKCVREDCKNRNKKTGYCTQEEIELTMDLIELTFLCVNYNI